MTRKEEGSITGSNEENFDDVFAEITNPSATDTATDEDATQSGGEGGEASSQSNDDEGADDTPNPSGEGDEPGTNESGNGNANEDEVGAAQRKPESKPAAKAGDDEDPAVWRQRYLTLQGKFNKLASQRQPQQHQQQPEDGSDEQDTGKKKPDPAQQLADEDRELLEQLDSELPLVGKAVRKLLETQQKTLLTAVEQKLAPVARTVQLTEEDKHFAAIYEAHDDFDDIVAGEELYEFIDSQPSYIQSGMRAVLDRGTAEEVIDLFSRFKEATGKAGAQRQEGRQQQEDPVVARRKKQLEDAGAVRSRTPAAPPTKGVASDDFDGAFDAVAASRNRK